MWPWPTHQSFKVPRKCKYSPFILENPSLRAYRSIRPQARQKVVMGRSVDCRGLVRPWTGRASDRTGWYLARSSATTTAHCCHTRTARQSTAARRRTPWATRLPLYYVMSKYETTDKMIVMLGSWKVDSNNICKNLSVSLSALYVTFTRYAEE